MGCPGAHGKLLLMVSTDLQATSPREKNINVSKTLQLFCIFHVSSEVSENALVSRELFPK